MHQEAVDHNDRLPIPIVAGKALIFDLDVIERLRALGIGGVLTGTLPTAPQQNIFLGIPLQLMVEEVVWLVDNGLAYLLPEKQFLDELIENLSDDDVKSIQYERFKSMETEKNDKLIQLNKKLDSLDKNHQSDQQKKESINQTLTIKIDDNSNSLTNNELFKSIISQNQTTQQKLLASLKFDQLNYSVFNHLKQKGYFLAPGLRFGGKFIGYPGDPLRYHAHLIINTVKWNQDIGLMNIVNGGRLATGVKKVWLIGSERDEEEESKDEQDKCDKIRCFSVEWAGFG